MRTTIGAAVAALVLASSAAVVDAKPASHDTSPVWELPAVATLVPGASASMIRSNGGVTIRVDSSGFGAHHAVTLWAVSFDQPENCTNGGPLPDGRTALCGPGDDAPDVADDTGFGVQQVGGHIVGANGNANFAGHVEVANTFGAEFHVVLADHGPMDPAQLPGQIMSPAAGSQIAFFIP